MASRFMASDSLLLPNSSLSSTKMYVGRPRRRRLDLTRREYLRICCHASSPPLPVETGRRTANYQPSSWDYDLLQSLTAASSISCEFGEERAKLLKEDIRRLLRDEQAKACEIVLMIDNIQRLGLEHHFEEDTILALHRVLPNLEYTSLNGTVSHLHFVALSFRLLREHGFEVSQEIFEKFKGKDGLFKTKLIEDVEGMLSLYEASQLGFQEENVLDEAKVYTRKNLTEVLNLSAVAKSLIGRINHALELPFHRQMRRLEARWNVESYESYDPQSNDNHAILHLAKFDFNFVQSVHQEELQELTRWWKGLGLSKKLMFARDRLVECHFWSVGMVQEPKYSKCRKALTKVASFITVLDDVYDVYGTMEELELFTCAVERWDVRMVNDMPDYMKLCFLAFFNTINEIAYDILEEQGINAIPYLAKAWADLLHTFMKEAKWYSAKHTPTLQEYLKNGWLSSSGPLLLVHAYFFTSDNMDTQELEKLQNYHSLLHLSSLIFRLCNDSSTFKAEIEKGDVASAIQCYMKDTGGTEEEAIEHIANLIEETWKKLNKEATSNSSSFSKAFVKIAVDLARISHVHYQYGDGHGAPDSRSKNRVSSLFIQPI